MVALETRLHHGRELSALVARLVNGDAQRSQSRQVHEQVVHQIAEPSIAMASDDGAQCHTVGATEGVVAHIGIQFTIVHRRQVLLSFDVQRHVEIAHTFLQPFYAHFVAAVPQISVHLVLVDDVLQPTTDKTRHIFGFGAHFPIEYLVDVNGFFRNFLHDKNILQKYVFFFK